MKRYNFDAITNRTNTDSVKYDLRKFFFGTEDVIPMWVADMDFNTPDFILDAIHERINHPVLGYSIRSEEYYNSIRNWMYRRHNWKIKNEWISFSPGIVPALNMIVLAFTKPGDKIIVQPPVYFPFFGAVKNHQRVLVENQLNLVNGRYEINYKDLERKCSKGASMIIISNPHNPGGNAWRSDELQKVTEICMKHDVLIVSDEIHSDLVNKGYKHTVLASLSNEIAAKTITLHAPSKTFNIAALSTASVIISNPRIRKVYNKFIQDLHIDLGNVFGSVASIAAFNNGDEWLNQLIEYIDENIKLLDDYLKKIPQISMIKPEATYMVWLDCKKLGMSDKQLSNFFIKNAHLGLNPGIQFGKGGSGFMRMNLACPRQTLLNALNQLNLAIENHFSLHQ